MLNRIAPIFLVAMLLSGAEVASWPEITREARPWSYWWWMASAVDEANLTRELERYSRAGWGGVHIIPIYGARGYESRYIEYLSPKWMAMLDHSGKETKRLGMGLDMTLGTGWCFGGPNIGPEHANIVVVPRKTPDGRWEIATKPTMRVKRAAPGGEGFMLNPLYGEAIRHYLRRFTDAFANYSGAKPRAVYHDSFEYNANWSPDLPEEFARRRGYRLENEYDALFGGGAGDRASRVRSDYRETLSDLLVEHFAEPWIGWAHQKGFLTRNQAHGSPGNLIDLYAAADIPETEMFLHDRSTIVSKLASSAAHIMGRRLVASETGTWLKEHFQETFADMKDLVQQLFLSGVNHIFYHGTCYSPDEAPWPGWVFYASTQMNPRNPIWRDAPAFNQWVARSQAMLQKGSADNDVLLYWPIYDVWQQQPAPGRLEWKFTVHDPGWLIQQPFGAFAQKLYDRGWAFDFISDRLLQQVRVENGVLRTPGARYRVVLAPATERMPVETLARLLELAEAGATVIFDGRLPDDVPGLGRLEERRAKFTALKSSLDWRDSKRAGVREARRGRGRVLVGAAEDALEYAGIRRESLTDTPGLQYVRRIDGEVRDYFLANRGTQAIARWLPLAHAARYAFVMDPMSGATGRVPLRRGQVYVQLQPGESLFLRLANRPDDRAPAWTWRRPAGTPAPLTGQWRVEFIEGGPEKPPAAALSKLVSWTEFAGEAGERFGGTARYTLTFDAPAGEWFLDLGSVAESAQVKLNGRGLGTLFGPRWRVFAGRLQPSGNRLEIEVTNVAANRIRDLDRRKVVWRVFHDANVVNTAYKPFDASLWPVRPSGLLGPVTLVRAERVDPGRL